MPADGNAPQFVFDTPPPFSYEEFKTQYLGKVLNTFDGPGGEYLRGLPEDMGEFLARFLYVAIVTKRQHPDMSESQLMYAANYGLIRHFIAEGLSPEEARDQLTQVPWDTLPGMDEYDRETTNAVARRAYEDVVAGRSPQSPLH